MANLTQEVKEFALNLGIKLIGVATTEEMNRLAPEGSRPCDYLKKAKSVVVIGLRWIDPIIDGIPDTRGIYSRMMSAVDWELDHLLYKLSCFLTGKGHVALPIPAEGPYDMGRLVGMLSHKHAAVLAGMGEFGLSNLVLTSEYGPRQRFASVLTEAMLDPSDRVELGLCENTLDRCQRSCITICPVGALRSALDMSPSSVRLQGLPIHKAQCQYFMTRGLPKVIDTQYKCGLCVKECPVGLKRVAPTGLEKAPRPI